MSSVEEVVRTYLSDFDTVMNVAAEARGIATALAAAGIGDVAEAERRGAKAEAARWREKVAGRDRSGVMQFDRDEAYDDGKRDGAQAVLNAVEALAAEYEIPGEFRGRANNLCRADAAKDFRRAAREAARNAGGGAS